MTIDKIVGNERTEEPRLYLLDPKKVIAELNNKLPGDSQITIGSFKEPPYLIKTLKQMIGYLGGREIEERGKYSLFVPPEITIFHPWNPKGNIGELSIEKGHHFHVEEDYPSGYERIELLLRELPELSDRRIIAPSKIKITATVEEFNNLSIIREEYKLEKGIWVKDKELEQIIPTKWFLNKKYVDF